MCYLKVFGGIWFILFDLSDFYDFIGLDLYVLYVNVYYCVDGMVYLLVCDKGKVYVSFE